MRPDRLLPARHQSTIVPAFSGGRELSVSTSDLPDADHSRSRHLRETPNFGGAHEPVADRLLKR